MTRLALLLALLLSFSACGGRDSSPISPGSTNSSPTQTLLSLNGIVTSSGVGVAGAAVTIMDSVNQGQGRTTDAAGNYSFTNLTPTLFTLQASAPGHTPQNKSVNLTTANQTVSFALVKPNPIFLQTGIGDIVFTMPAYVQHVRIQASYSGKSSLFAVYIDESLFLTSYLGTDWDSTPFDVTYPTSGGVVEIRNSSGVSWVFTEVPCPADAILPCR